jgi:hypothetical protein
MALMNQKLRLFARALLDKRDGRRCKTCGQRPPTVYLEIHHRDHNPHNNPKDGSNWEYECKSDNRKIDPRGKQYRKASFNSTFPDAPRPTSAEFEKGEICEKIFRHWLKDKCKSQHQVPLEGLDDSAAEVAGCSQQTIKRYLKKCTSGEGEYRLFPDDYNVWFVKLKTSHEVTADMV